jgi:hypothetical protein
MCKLLSLILVKKVEVVQLIPERTHKLRFIFLENLFEQIVKKEKI